MPEKESEGKAAMDDHARKRQKTDAGTGDGDKQTVKNREEDSKSFQDFLGKLKSHVSEEEAMAIVKANGQDFEPESSVLEHCADQMMYGLLAECPNCGGCLQFVEHEYTCTGFVSEWSKCNYSTKAAPRKNEPLHMPKDVKNDFLQKWAKEHDPKGRPVRNTESSGKPFSGQHIMLVGRMSKPQYQYRNDIEKLGGKVTHIINEGTTCLVISEKELSSGVQAKIGEARSKKVPVVREPWLKDSLTKQEAQPFEPYDMSGESKPKEATTKPQPSADADLPSEPRRKDALPPVKDEDMERSLIAEIKMTGKRSVHKDSRLQEEGGHILEHEGIIYNCAFAVSDQTAGLHHFAIMQLVQLPNGSLYLYYKKGRVADGMPMREQLEEQSSLQKAVDQFAKLFEELTGNEFEPWERQKKFTKKRLKLYPLDMADGVDARAGGLRDQQLGIVAVHTKLDPRIAKVLKRLFSQLVYRQAMFEMGVDSLELPSGILTEFHLKRCEEVLLEFAEFLKHDKSDHKKHERMCMDLSNKWFSLVPSPRPMVINDISQLAELAAPSLEALRNISIASRIMGNMTDDPSDDLLGDRYAKMNCTLTPVDHNSDEFQMIQKYFEKTYEPMKYEDMLVKATIEDVFAVESSAMPSMEELAKIPNKVLLWCGSRTCNMVGCLAKGMVPAFFQAPVPGYTFGRGYYCSDASCKAARYAFTGVDEPDGYLVVSIVGLGDKVMELAEPTEDVSKYEREKCAIKALGKKQPDQSEYFKYKDITVPCGTLKPSGPEDSLLDYNEYIVYDPKQVRVQFMVQIRYTEEEAE